MDEAAKGDAYRKLFEVIRRCAAGDGLVVLSTNYDLVFEFFAWKEGRACTYPLTDVDFHAAKTGKKSILAFDKENAPLVCKLHGSVNLFSVENRLLVADELEEGGGPPVGKSSFQTERPTILGVDAIWSLQNEFGSSLVPAIVPPTYAKLTRQAWLREIWKAAFEANRDATKIVFIGYSMPESDGFMRALLHAALAQRHGGRAPDVHVIDPSEEVLIRYRTLLSGACSRHLQTFAEASTAALEEILGT